MREIKYRGFDPITKKFIYGNLLFTNETYYVIPFLTNGCMSQKEMMLRWVSPCYQVIPETVGQFTGLRDKNGVEIYEGDRIKVFGFTINPKTKEKIPYNVTAIVKYSENTACFLYLVDDSCVWSNFRYTKLDGLDYEVIGNIHERSKQDEEVK